MYTAAAAAAHTAAGVRLDYNFAILLPLCYRVIGATIAVIIAVIVLIGSVEQAPQILKRFAALLICQATAAFGCCCSCSSRGSGRGRGRALLYVIVLLIGLLLLLATRDAFDLFILLVLFFFGLFAAALNVFC